MCDRCRELEAELRAALALLKDERRNLIRNVFEHDDARKEALAALALQAQEVEKLKTQWREQSMDGHYHSFIRTTLKNCIGDLEQALPSAAAPVKENT